MSDHDLGSWILGEDLRTAAMKTIARGKYFTDNFLKSLEKKNRNEYSGITAACPRGSPGWVKMQGASGAAQEDDTKGGPSELYQTDNVETSFIHNASSTYDFCYNADVLFQHGGLSIKHERDSALRPIFQLSKFARNPEFLTTPLDAYENATSSHSLSWDEKTEDKVLWRGTTTGDSYSKRKSYDWHKSHRPRLVLMANSNEGKRDIWVKRNGMWQSETWPLAELNAHWMDVALSAEPHQCNKEDGTCEEMSNELTKKPRVNHDEAAKYKCEHRHVI